jgi:hypothetical protein
MSKTKTKKPTKSKTNPKKPSPPETLSLTVVDGVDGPAVYLNDFRIAGPKPWGGDEIIYEFDVEVEDVITAMNQP